ncbi:MAG: TolC family protein [Mariprofundaceae bacterium]|nr:TolC family protein [Mariprofundaceae bacterium]
MNQMIGRWIFFSFYFCYAGLSQAEEAGLAAALHSTIALHPAMHGKQAEIEAKEFAADSARAQRYPSMSSQLGRRGKNNVATLVVRQPIWAFGRIDHTIAYADADKKVNEQDFLRVKRRLLEDTAVAYAVMEGMNMRLDVAIENVDAHEKLHQQIQRRYKGKLASKTDVLLAAVRLRQARAQVLRVQGEKHIALDDLQALTQVAIDTSEKVSDSFRHLDNIHDIEGLAAQQDATVQYKKQLVDLALKNIGQVRSAAMPTVYVQAERNFNAPGYARGTNYSVMVDGNLDGFGLAVFGRTSAARSQLEAAKRDLDSTRNDIRRKVKTLMNNRGMQASLMEGIGLAVDDLQVTLNSYNRQYGAGFKAWLEVLNLQRELSDQKTMLAQAKSEWLIQTLRIQAMTGLLDQVSAKEK